ncbi:MAG: RHS repeat domain-containing protein, partial [Candidatus Amoebophilus sp.]
ITQVDNGILVTKQYYTRLHLELEVKTFAKDNLDTPINHITNSFKGEKKGGYFPPYTELPSNYQTPTLVTTNIFNDKGERLIQKVETDFDDYGASTEIRSYKTITQDSNFTLIDKVHITYDNVNYGQVIQRDSYDYTDDSSTTPTIKRLVSHLTADKKTIETTTEGFVVYENEQYVFNPNKKTTYNYDKLGRVTFDKLEWADGQPHSLPSTETSTHYSTICPELTITNTNAQEQSSIVKVDTTTGLTISKTNALGNSINYSYDNIGRTLKVMVPLGAATHFVYEDTLNKMTTKYANGYETYVYYNRFGESIKTCDNIGNDHSERILGIKSYNDKGQLIFEEGILGVNSRTTYQYNNKGQLFKVTDALGNVKKYEYDPVAQKKTEYFNDIKVAVLSQNNNIVTETNYASSSPNDYVKSIKNYNSYSKVSKIVLGEKSSSHEWLETKFLYDVGLNIASYTLTGSDSLTKSHTTLRDLFNNSITEKIEVSPPGVSKIMHAKSDTYTYNNINQLIEERNSLNQSYKYTYNAVGLQSSYTDYTGTIFNYDYYANNQIASITYQDKNDKKHEQKFTYYPLTHELQYIEEFYDGISQGRIGYTYSLDGKVESVTYPDGKQILYQYDNPKDVLTQFVDAIGKVTKYSYDDYGRLIGQQIAGTDYNITVSYYNKKNNPTHSGKIESIKVSNGVVNSYYYDDFGSISKVTITDTNSSFTNNIILSTEYSYDHTTRNIIHIKYSSTASPQEQAFNYNVSYTYNASNQLITERVTNLLNKLISSTNYTYDAASNVTKEEITNSTGELSTTIYSYDADNKLVTVTSPSGIRNLAYDIHGNLVDDGLGCSLIYDERNRLIGYNDIKNSIQAKYSYYPNGLRANKKANKSELIQFYYDHASHPNIINEVQGSQSSSYLMLGNKRHIRLVHNSNNKVAVQYLIDNLKDTIGIVNSVNKLDKTYNYEAYGQERKLAIPTDLPFILPNINNNPFRYTNEYLDFESGLIYLRSRYYNPNIKRFISRDETMLINRYNYGEGNPIMFTDPSGELSWEGVWSIIGGVAAIVGSIALTVATAGAATPGLIAAGAAAGALIGAGASSAIYGATHMDNFDSKDYGAMVGFGIASGAAGGVFGIGLGAAGLSAGRALAADVIFNTGLSSLDSYVTNGTINSMHGQSFNEGASTAAGYGALAGGITSGALVLFGRGVAIRNSNILREAGADTNVGIGLLNKKHPFSHSTIRINRIEAAVDQIVEGTELTSLVGSTVGLRSNPTKLGVFGEFNPIRAREVNLRVQMDRAEKGLTLINQLRRQGNLGNYNLLTNSCTSNVVNVLHKMGFTVPIFARTPWMLHTWARGLRFSGPV